MDEALRQLKNGDWLWTHGFGRDDVIISGIILDGSKPDTNMLLGAEVQPSLGGLDVEAKYGFHIS